MTNLVESIKAVIGQRQQSAADAKKQALDELHRILARCNKPKSDDDARLLALADTLNIAPESLAQMAEVVLQAITLQAAGSTERLQQTALAYVRAGAAVSDYEDETQAIVEGRKAGLSELEQARGQAGRQYDAAQEALKALRELAAGEHAELLRQVLAINVDTMAQPFDFYIPATNQVARERKGKP